MWFKPRVFTPFYPLKRGKEGESKTHRYCGGIFNVLQYPYSLKIYYWIGNVKKKYLNPT
jgi:hypothetical protein